MHTVQLFASEIQLPLMEITPQMQLGLLALNRVRLGNVRTVDGDIDGELRDDLVDKFEAQNPDFRLRDCRLIVDGKLISVW